LFFSLISLVLLGQIKRSAGHLEKQKHSKKMYPPQGLR